MKPKQQTRRPLVPRGVHLVPDGLTPDDFEWMPPAQVRAQIKRRDARELAAMWHRWRIAQDEILADWHPEQCARVEKIVLEIDAAQQEQQLRDGEEKRRTFIEADCAQRVQERGHLRKASHHSGQLPLPGLLTIVVGSEMRNRCRK